MSRRRKPRLSADDQEIWSKVAKTTRPLQSALMPAERHFERPPRPEDPTPAAPKTMTIRPFRVGQKVETGDSFAAKAPHAATAAHSPPRMDAGLYRKMMQGKIRPQARLDLHGMTLARAHPVLTDFIQRAADNQKRMVLVITGKGRHADDGGPIPIRQGVLRQQVPGWLSAPPLGALVLDVRPAHRRHGGDGAYYVYLRRIG